jgi:alkylhydroperoxidase family enzyme
LTESRLAPLAEARWTDEQRALVQRYAPEVRIGNAFLTLLNVPELVEAVMPFVIYTASDSTLEARHRELLILRTAWLCQNSYLWADHAPSARMAAVTAEEMRRIAQGPTARGWEPFEATLLRLADELFRNSSVSDETWVSLQERYDLYNLVDAVMTVNQTALLSMLFNSLGVQPDEGAMARFPADVPYRLDVADPPPPLREPRVEPIEGSGLRVSRTFARHPRMAAARSGQSRYVNSVSPLTPYFRELLILRIGWNCQAVYEWAKHVGSVGRARDRGLEPERIARGPDAGWNDFEQAHLRAADEIYRDGIISEGTWSTLSERYDTRELMSVVMTVANYRLVSMSLNALGVQPLETDELFPTLQ